MVMVFSVFIVKDLAWLASRLLIRGMIVENSYFWGRSYELKKGKSHKG